jgi:hypothetical protein
MGDRSDSEGYTEEYFVAHFDGSPPLPMRARKCHDCAVESLYRGISNDLARCPLEVIDVAVPRWFCHTTPRFACRGNADNVKSVLSLPAHTEEGAA